MKTGLVLEGGGMRGLYTVGVLDCLMEQEITVDYCIGVSAGAANGVSFVSGQKGRSLRINTEYLDDKRYLSLSNFMRSGSLFGMDFIFEEIPERLDPFDYDAFLRAPCEFVAGVTDARTGKPAYFDKAHLDHDSTVLKASAAIPGFSKVVPYHGGFYFDGGTADPIPAARALKDGCTKLLVILTNHRGYQKTPQRLRRAYSRALRDYPEMVRLLDRRHEIYTAQQKFVDELEKAGNAIVIAPSRPLTVTTFEKNPETLKGLWTLGQEDCINRLPQLKAFFKK